MNDIPKIAFGKLGTFMDYVFHSPDWAVVVALKDGSEVAGWVERVSREENTITIGHDDAPHKSTVVNVDEIKQLSYP